jgi:uncharacterized protein YcgI (DUF1989 family)
MRDYTISDREYHFRDCLTWGERKAQKVPDPEDQVAVMQAEIDLVCALSVEPKLTPEYLDTMPEWDILELVTRVAQDYMADFQERQASMGLVPAALPSQETSTGT